MTDDGTIDEDVKERVTALLRQSFRPEFLNRVDEIIVFHALEQGEIDEIARLMMNGIKERLLERGIELVVEDAALRIISKSGYDLQYGARPLRRAIQRLVEDSLSEEILMGNIKLGDKVVACEHDGEVKFVAVRENI